MLVIKRSLAQNKLQRTSHCKNEFRLTRRIVSKKRKIIDKITKKLLRQLKQKEGQRIKQNKMQADAVGD